MFLATRKLSDNSGFKSIKSSPQSRHDTIAVLRLMRRRRCSQAGCSIGSFVSSGFSYSPLQLLHIFGLRSCVPLLTYRIMPRSCRSCFLVSSKVQFIWNDGWQAAVAIFRCAGFPVDFEHHRLVCAVTADAFVAETFHVCGVECVPPEMPILFQPSSIVYFCMNLPHGAFRPVFSDS